MKRLLLLKSGQVAALLISLCPGLLLAQDTSADAVDGDTGVEQSSQAEQQAQAEQSVDGDGAGVAVDAIADADQQEESSARFIPSEEISQDLGVSFPVDI